MLCRHAHHIPTLLEDWGKMTIADGELQLRCDKLQALEDYQLLKTIESVYSAGKYQLGNVADCRQIKIQSVHVP